MNAWQYISNFVLFIFQSQFKSIKWKFIGQLVIALLQITIYLYCIEFHIEFLMVQNSDRKQTIVKHESFTFILLYVMELLWKMTI